MRNVYHQTLDQLVDIFDLPSFEDIEDKNSEAILEAGDAALQRVLEYGGSRAEAEEARERSEAYAMQELWDQYMSAVLFALEYRLAEYGLEVVALTGKKYRGEYTLVPTESWKAVCAHLVHTINGVGIAQVEDGALGLLRYGDYASYKQCALDNLHHINSFAAVYGAGTMESLFYKHF